MAGFPVQGIFVFPEHPSNSYSMRTPWAFWLLIACLLPAFSFGQIFYETFNDTVNAPLAPLLMEHFGIVVVFCNVSTGGTFESNGTSSLVDKLTQNQVAHWSTGNIDVSSPGMKFSFSS